MSQKIPLGSKARCVISGVSGTVVSLIERLNGNIQHGVQPKSENGITMPEAWEIDVQSLEVTDPGISGWATEPVPCPIKLGQRVRDWITGYEGVAASKHTYFNGCVHFIVVPLMKKGKTLLNEAPQGSYLSVERLRVIEESSSVLPADHEPTEKPTGGPSRRMVRNV